MSTTTLDSGGNANAVAWYLDRHVERSRADTPCLISDEEHVTYRALHDRVCRTAGLFAEGGVGLGDRVVVLLPDCVTFVVAVLAAMRVGAVPVPTSPVLTIEEQAHIIEDCGARAVVVDDPSGAVTDVIRRRFPDTVLWSRRGGPGLPGLAEQADAATPYTAVAERSAADPALMQYTSGSTGQSKGVVHLHGGLLGLPPIIARHLSLTSADRILSTAKLPFGYGFGNSLLLPFAVGASAVLFEGRADPHNVSRLVRAFQPTLLFSVPTLYAGLLAIPGAPHRLDLSSVRLAVSAGEHLGATLGGKLTDVLGLSMVNGLGATECLHICLCTDPAEYTPGSTGQPLPGIEVELLDEQGQELHGPGAGRLRVGGPGVAAGYWNQPELTAETFRDGAVHTSDVVRREADGSWNFLGRTDSVLNVGGMKVVTSEIEETILRTPGVRACAVVGVPDEDDLTRIVAYVVAQPGTAHELPSRVLADLRAALPPYQRPQRIRVVNELPTTSTGKTARFLIRSRERESRP
jgi:benzoate-CoA ligase family protein